MGWFNSAAEKIKEAAEAAARGAREAAEATARAAKAAAEATARAAAVAAQKAKEAAEATAAAAKAAAEAAAAKIKEAAEATAAAAKAAAEKTGNSFVDAADAASRVAVSAWSASSDEAQALGSVIEKNGITIGNGFIAGATVVGDGIGTGAEVVGKGAVALGKYVSNHACDIALGSALSAAFVTLAADGEEEASVGSLAVLAATRFVDKVALKTAADALAFIVVEPVYLIPGVSSSIGHKSELESICSFLITKACSQNPKMVVGSGGQFIAGVLIYGITSVVCEGKVPGGYHVWKGAQASIT